MPLSKAPRTETPEETADLRNFNFKVHASVIYQLGEALIEDEITALSELLKNSYDADASYCSLTVEPYYESDGRQIGRITVSDDGCGMSLQTITDGWLTISNSPKRQAKQRGETTPKFHRIPLGDKGLGRLSVQKLGKRVKMITKRADSVEEYSVTIPWDSFLEDKTVDQIPVFCQRRKVSDDNSYTRIVITDLVNPEIWTSAETIKNLEYKIGQILSPFRSRTRDFTVSARVASHEIDVSNALFQEVLKTARSVYSFSVRRDKIILTCQYKRDFFRRKRIVKQYPEFDFQADYLTDMFQKLKGKGAEWTLRPSEDVLYEARFRFSAEAYPSLYQNQASAYPGDFDGKIYDFTLDGDYVKDVLKSNALADAFQSNRYSDYVKRNSGIRVIRDDFIVQGYEDGVDWLNLSSSVTTTGKWNNLNNSSVIGYVQLTGEKNACLRETTSREGLVEDAYYHTFYELLRFVIKVINRQILSNLKTFSEYLFSVYGKPESGEQAIDNLLSASKGAANVALQINKSVRKLQREVSVPPPSLPRADNADNPELRAYYEGIIQKQNAFIKELQDDMNKYLSDVFSLQKDIQKIRWEIERYQEKMGDVFSLAGLGISVEMFTHELYATMDRLDKKAKTLPSESPEMRYTRDAIGALRKQFSHFYPGLKFVRAKKERISALQLVKSHLAFHADSARAKGIELVEPDEADFMLEANVGMLNQVLDNLYSNSVYWLSYSKSIGLVEHCEYHIEILKNQNALLVWDNGIGIAREVEADLFDPFVTCKENGRGLGLFICKTNLEGCGCLIRLFRERRNERGNLYQFLIDLSNLTV